MGALSFLACSGRLVLEGCGMERVRAYAEGHFPLLPEVMTPKVVKIYDFVQIYPFVTENPYSHDWNGTNVKCMEYDLNLSIEEGGEKFFFLNFWIHACKLMRKGCRKQ